jgi:hydrogenase nickel incorporation protein HypB
MCATCGCDARVGHEHDGADHDHPHHHGDAHEHAHPHGDDHDHPHHHGDGHHRHDPDLPVRRLQLEQDLLAKNDALAARNRRWLAQRGILAFNLLSGPGAGKTTLLEQTIARLAPARVAVLEGDQDTTRDAERVRAAGADAFQINTGTGCHLDAAMVGVALDELQPQPGALLFVENVGNLVCPSLFDLGERGKVLLLSVTEGEDKPLKYPHAFRAASVLVLTKIDLLPHLEFDLDRCLGWARRVNPELRIFTLSALRGPGMDAWCSWLRAGLAETARADDPVLVGPP